MSPAVAWFWRLVALALFVAFMLGFTWMLRQGVDALPDIVVASVLFCFFGFAAGYFMGVDHGRKQERRRG